MTNRRITLSRTERFEIWGHTVTELRFQDGTDDGDWAALYSGREGHREYVGTVKVGSVADVMNAIEARRPRR